MMNFDRVLFPVDFSDPCRRAAPFVRAVAKHFRSELVMFYVLQVPPPWYPPDAAPEFQSLADLDELRAQRRADLQNFLSEEFRDLAVRREMAEGEPAVQIVKSAQQENVSLIMMPTHGYGPLRVLLLGSVTAKVLDDAQCPVWTAVHTNELQAQPPERWRRILCAVELNTDALRVVRWAADLARTEGADLCVMHAVDEVDPDSTWPEESTREWIRETARQKLGAMLQDYVRGVDRRLAIEFGDPASAVRAAAMRREADIVVIGRGAANGPLGRLRTHTYAIIRQSPCPVFRV